MLKPRLAVSSLFLPEHSRRDRIIMRALLVALGTLLAVGFLLTARRLFGGATEPLPVLLLVPTAVGSFVLVEGGRRMWRHLWHELDTPQQRWRDVALGWLGTVALALMAVGCIYPGYQTAEWLAWLPLLLTDQFRRQTFFERGRVDELAMSASATEAPATPLPEDAPPALPPAESSVCVGEELSATDLNAPDDCGEALSSGPLAGEVLQQLFRVRDEQGIESVYGVVAADFRPGQRHAVLHVGFCPPLDRMPAIEAEPCAGPDARVKVLQGFAHGAKLEVRLAEPARAPCRVTVDLAAVPMNREQTASA